METVQSLSRQAIDEYPTHFSFGVLDGEMGSAPGFLPLAYTPVSMQKTREIARSGYLVWLSSARL